MKNMLNFHRSVGNKQRAETFSRLLVSLIVSVFFLVPGVLNVIYAQPQEKVTYDDLSVELTILYNNDSKTIKVIKQRILNFPPPKHRSKKVEGDQFVFQYEDSLGVVLGGVPVNDPSRLRSEWVDENATNEPGLLTGKKLDVAETVFQVIIPFKENLDRVKLMRPKGRQNGKQPGQAPAERLRTDSPEDRFEVIGRSPVDRGIINAFVSRKKQK